ncbi:class I SAM-dependent methyltransferase [Pseudorhodoplanes sp.]|uniref:class I SAM-dependent methyltransferase n=1 Tax=Pseudorhodoplanes sp. TaxID=1934341 RepID=UPI002C1888A0|nr:class I SAM-dependent methyltransferase [Pseudorhodoplanes sp.]HWV51443.1 class I SAM-dependent methyltransferase [Pseudorhodoplanes sp.]
MSSWVTFFDSDHAIYVNARHKEVHAIVTGDGMAQYIAHTDRVLDYGCGEAAYAERLVRKAESLTLCEAAPKLRERLKARVQHERYIAVLSPEDVAALPDGSFEVIIMHSVSQYLSPAELDRLLAEFRRLLQPTGKLVIGDVVQPDTPAWKDALALVQFGWREGFFFAALGGLFRTVFSDYAKLRKDAGLTRYSEHDIAAKLNAAGYRASRAPRNIGHLQTRMTFVASKS